MFTLHNKNKSMQLADRLVDSLIEHSLTEGVVDLMLCRDELEILEWGIRDHTFLERFLGRYNELIDHELDYIPDHLVEYLDQPDTAFGQYYWTIDYWIKLSLSEHPLHVIRLR